MFNLITFSCIVALSDYGLCLWNFNLINAFSLSCPLYMINVFVENSNPAKLHLCDSRSHKMKYYSYQRETIYKYVYWEYLCSHTTSGKQDAQKTNA